MKETFWSLGKILQRFLCTFEMELDGGDRPLALGGDLPSGLVIYPKSSEDPTRPLVQIALYEGREKPLKPFYVLHTNALA